MSRRHQSAQGNFGGLLASVRTPGHLRYPNGVGNAATRVASVLSFALSRNQLPILRVPLLMDDAPLVGYVEDCVAWWLVIEIEVKLWLRPQFQRHLVNGRWATGDCDSSIYA